MSIRKILPAFLVVTMPLTMLALSSWNQDQEKPEEIGSESCTDCHFDMIEKVESSIHGRLGVHEMDPERTCEACHGPGSNHADSEGEVPIAHRFRGDNRESDIRMTCERCHIGGETISWHGSAHDASGVTCLECHDVKAPHRKQGAIEQTNACATCHSDQVALFNMPSHHPLREGKMRCLDCHNPHGGGDQMMLRADSINELCLSCHAEKQGPFLYEHESVQESCLLCHDAKGGVHNNLLKMTEPSLCLRCHTGHEDVHPRLNTPEFRAGYLGKCSSCHSQIHGSDLPGFVGPSKFIR